VHRTIREKIIFDKIGKPKNLLMFVILIRLDIGIDYNRYTKQVLYTVYTYSDPRYKIKSLCHEGIIAPGKPYSINT